MNKMMKILVAVFAVVLSLNLIGCGGDDSSDPGPNPDPTCTGGRTYNGTECVCPVGTWNGTSCTVLDTENPTVTLTDPSDSTTVSGTILVAATASDNIGIDRVEFKYGDNLICTDNAPPYECSWNTNAVSDGDYSVAAHAYDQAGNTASNHAVVTVRNTVDVCAAWRGTNLENRNVICAGHFVSQTKLLDWQGTCLAIIVDREGMFAWDNPVDVVLNDTQAVYGQPVTTTCVFQQ